MPHESLRIIPGVDTAKTQTLNEAAISACNLIRFQPDASGACLVQKLGGWTRYDDYVSGPVIRSLHAWADTNDNSYLAKATTNTLIVDKSDVTPQQYYNSVTTDLSSTAGSPQIIVVDNGSSVSSFDSVYFVTPVAIGGIVISGFYPVIAQDTNHYRIDAKDVLGNPVNAITTELNAGSVPVFDSTNGAVDVKVTLTNHGYSNGDTFPIQIETKVGGITFYGNYIVRHASDNDFTISGGSAANLTETVPMNGGKTLIHYYIGQRSTTVGNGFGVGGFGQGGFGVGVVGGSGRTVIPTAASCVGKNATLTIPPGLGILPGGKIIVSGITPAGYNGQWTVASSTDTSVTYKVPATLSPGTAFGSIIFLTWKYPAVVDWCLDNWGEDLISCPHDDGIYYWQPTTGSDHSAVVPNAPLINTGMFVAMPQRQIIAYGSTFTGIKDPLLVRWCDVGDLTKWIGTVRNQAGSFRIPRGSKIVGAIQAPQQGLLWTDVGIWSMQYIGQPYVYSFNEMSIGCGLIGQHAVGTLAGVVYWMSQSQFYRLGANGAEIINCPVWDLVFRNIDMNYTQNIRAAPNSRFGEISWYYPTVGSNGIPNRYVKYNYLIGQWDYGTLTRTAWIDQSVLGGPIGAGPISGGSVAFQHETSPDADGKAIKSSFITGFFSLMNGDFMSFIDQVWPDMKWGYPNNNTASVTLTFYVCDYPGDTPRVQTFVLNSGTKFVTPRIRGRLVAVGISSKDIGSFWRLGNIRYRYSADGKF